MKIIVFLILSYVSVAFSASVQLGTCALQGTSVDPTVTGRVKFTQINATHVRVDADITGITQRVMLDHGMHVHEWGDISAADGSAAGGHWNPAGVDHGCPDAATRHIGDMGNFSVSDTGAIAQTKVLDLLTLTGGNSLIGRAVILHFNFDDCTGTVGNAGTRLAQCVIGLAEPDINTDTNDAGASPGISQAICVVQPTNGNNVTGIVVFTQTGGTGDTRVRAQLTGLDGNPHGFHIHQFGDVSSPTGTAAGGHYNPMDTHHAIPPFPVRHVGDMGNIYYYDNGTAWYDYTNDMISLNGANSVVGRAVIIHANQDDCRSPVGNAGSRWGQCVIGVMDPTDPMPFTVPSAAPDTQDETPCYALYTLPETATGTSTEDSAASVPSVLLALVAALALLCSLF